MTLDDLTPTTPVRNSSIALTDGGGAKAQVSEVLGLIELTDLPSGDAQPGQCMIWNGEAWVPATVLQVLMSDLPTSPDGLPSNALWNNGLVLCIAP